MDCFGSCCRVCPMGTSAFRGEYSVVHQPGNTKWSRMSCEECNLKFSVLRRKRTCGGCGHQYCGNCLKKEKGMERSPQCHRCRVFATVPLDRIAVSELKVRDLRWFLQLNRIPTHGCKEKVELVDLIMHHSDLQNAYPQNYERHTVRLESDRQTANARDSPVFRPRHQEPMNFAPTPSEGAVDLHSDNVQGLESEADGFTLINLEEELERLPDERGSARESDVPGSQNTVTDPETLRAVHEHMEQHMESTDEGGKDNAEGGMLPTLSINDITSAEDISSLSVMQLKLILTRNFVSFKGCCEKHELQEKVQELWKRKQECKNIENISDENLCKICMEAVIDSVLLDCGHLVSCTECGKRLNECPICRQYVVRVVHTFKA